MEIRENLLPVLKPFGGEEEVQAVREVIESGWWGKGPKVAEFEEKFAKMVGHKYAVAVTSNSHGQDLIMKAMGFQGIDIINPTMSFIATATIPLWNDCTSNIVDVRPEDLNICPIDVKKHLKRNSDALIAVNMAGVPAPIDEIREFYDGFIIEDCAHSCYVDGAGLKGDVAVWSFQAVKTMPMGDGGMIPTDNYELYCKLRDMTWFGVSSTWSRAQGTSGKPGYSWDYQVEILGYKYYMIDILAAIGIVQMDKLQSHLEKRRYIQAQYNEKLHPRIERPPFSETVQYYICRIPQYAQYAPDNSGATTANRDDLIDYLADKKIHTSVHFKPLHKYGILRQSNYRDYPVADSIWKSLITLPCHPGMPQEDIDYVIYWTNKYFGDK